ncbi:ATP-dependent DNA helicase [Paenibacillus sp. 1011MAR3C5]|uniref:ATP-dependent DNA helicase n=1 Tax=Paenibacillus sp. 1011MAR3C5 TaxID=1675787 RepID=UPI000E6B6566|nr:ATP-dependent DNA helicase [Paenibacillus sp. 1011MAR3C5]RJE86049.1 ATP-dependent DNA helicase [Paenibacillus sp. 1011MAR3C5]
MSETYTVSLSVRQLVEYVYSSGSIDARLQSADAMLDGTKAHQRIQSEYGEDDQKEVYLKADIVWGEGLQFAIDGRCDGLLASGAVPMIDEIKSTRGDLVRVKEEGGLPVHWAQAWFYAYMYARDNAVPKMSVQLTYVHTLTDETIRFIREASFEELQSDILGMIEQYAPYARLRREHELRRDASIGQLPFPFHTYRTGQRKLAGAVFKSIEEGVSLFARAPTGIGKTISTTYPAIKAIGQGLLQRIYYLTARTTTRAAAEDALRLMESQGLRLHAVTITAKDKICFQEETRCEKAHCPYADGYYDRINGAVLDILREETLLTRPVIERYARKHRVCPFEYSLDLAYAADMVICDYNYVFDPRVSFKRLYGEVKKRTALLVDEAHHLPDRGREMFSGMLTKAPFLALQRELKGQHPGAYSAAKAINDYFIARRKLLGDGRPSAMEQEKPEELIMLVERFTEEIEPLLEGDGATWLDLYFQSQQFLRAAKLYDARYATLTEVVRSDVSLKLYCLDPSELLKGMMKGYRSAIYFSATLTPLGYYMDMLGGAEEDYTISLASPFDSGQLDVSIHPISTRYHDRGQSYRPIAGIVHRMIMSRTGNYFVFFPSYAYMNAVHEAYIELMDSEEMPPGDRPAVQVQRSDMTEEERDGFLEAFQPGGERSLVGFAVMGGVFSEGVDLPGDRLIGVVVVGVGMPQLGLERDALRAYYQQRGNRGFHYAYVIPGMNKVLQAGGRLIRSETDEGQLMLIDDRYLEQDYRRLLPEEWLQAVKNTYSELLD